MFVVFAGGVGAARFLYGWVRVTPPAETTAIVNTGDDTEIYGLAISPDIDTVLYTLAGIVDHENGWGIAGDTTHALRALERLGQ
ncbi:MAG: 2-phospho-L-lactate transferase CofD family protein, partial [Dehalococcoidia bacterium]|nr:2-phospho-L-lactate transferase CofD family protein [Dehalococcoidia bacterium]